MKHTFRHTLTGINLPVMGSGGTKRWSGKKFVRWVVWHYINFGVYGSLQVPNVRGFHRGFCRLLSAAITHNNVIYAP